MDDTTGTLNGGGVGVDGGGAATWRMASATHCH